MMRNNIKTISYCSLGCKVNQYETESIINTFLENGFVLKNFHEICDVYIINTCTITNTGDAKSRKMIRQALKTNPNSIVAVMGCYAQLHIDEVRSIENVKVIVGTSNRNKIYDYVMKALETNQREDHYEDVMLKPCYEELKVTKFSDRTRGFVKIQDGCDNYCSYCAVPYARGHSLSRNPENIIEEVTKQTNQGVKEIVLTGINTGEYGKDLDNYSLSQLLQDLIKNVSNLGRIRISSIEATQISDEFLSILRENSSHFCQHLHIPIQAGCNKTLQRMDRKYNIEQYKQIIDKIRQLFPNINITTDIMVGFSGETNEDFDESLRFYEKIAFGEMHVFPYSRRPNTKAYMFLNQINEKEKHERVKKLLELNHQLALNYRMKFLNKTVRVLVERIDENNSLAFGHSSEYLEISFKSNKPLKTLLNTFVNVVITKVNYPLSEGVEENEIY